MRTGVAQTVHANSVDKAGVCAAYFNLRKDVALQFSSKP